MDQDEVYMYSNHHAPLVIDSECFIATTVRPLPTASVAIFSAMKFLFTVVASACLFIAMAHGFSLESVSSRREAISTMGGVLAGSLLSSQRAEASLLDEYGADPRKIEDSPTKTAAVVPNQKAESNYEPNLRSNYYYPTSKWNFSSGWPSKSSVFHQPY